MQAEIELRWMRLVVAVAEERNFTRAAERCNISQPALSRRVQEVESVIGIPLFERRTRSVSITQAGHLFVREARRTLEQGQRTISLVQALATQGQQPLTVGLSLLADHPRAHALIESAGKSRSAPSFNILTATTPELMLRLQRGDLDLAVVDLPAKGRGLRFAPLVTEQLIGVIPERLSSPRKQTVPLADLVKLPLVLLSQSVDPARAAIDQHVSSLGARGFRVHDAASIPELLDQVSIQSRASLLRQSATRFQRLGVVYKPLLESMQVGSALAWRADNRSPTLISFRDLLLTFARQLEQKKASGILRSDRA